jgi:hypothetical protein
LGEQAIQETLNQFALREATGSAVLLFEDCAIARNTFSVPPGCQKVSTSAFLIFLENKGWIASGQAGFTITISTELNRSVGLGSHHHSRL